MKAITEEDLSMGSESSSEVHMKPRIETAKDYNGLSARAARFLCDFLRATPHGVIALPTGRTPVGAYRQTVEQLRTGSLDCSGLFFVDVDELAGLPPDHPASCAQTLRRQLLDWHPISMASCRLLNGAAEDLVAEAESHELAIRDRGGVDLAVLGIGVNGHIALNEPGTAFDSRAYVSTLTSSTIERLPLPGVSDVMTPTLGLTLGIGTILQARRILLLASGEEKAHILDAALNGDMTERIPASALQMHPQLHVIADEAALALWKPQQERA
jgi:glucosamine-6-phosphate deaminase